jgi:hypothetical protein
MYGVPFEPGLPIILPPDVHRHPTLDRLLKSHVLVHATGPRPVSLILEKDAIGRPTTWAYGKTELAAVCQGSVIREKHSMSWSPASMHKSLLPGQPLPCLALVCAIVRFVSLEYDYRNPRYQRRHQRVLDFCRP